MPFDQPFKIRVLRAITDTLKTITPANDYVFNLADYTAEDGVLQTRVFRGRAWFGDSDPLPMLSVLEPEEAGEVALPPRQSTVTEYRWPLILQGFVADDKTNPTDPAYRLLADVRRRLSVERTRKAPGTNQPDPFGLGIAGPNRIDGLSFNSGVVRPADDVSATAYFWLMLELQIVESAADPYA